jgi:hypothetical protein
MVDGGDLFREGVNVAGRLQGMAEPGGVLISQAVYDQVRSKLPVGYEFLGQRRPKNLDDPVPVYRLLFDGRQPPRAAWPGIGKLGVLGIRAAPWVARGPINAQTVRVGVIIAVLALINLASGPSEPWFFSPAGALIVLSLPRLTGIARPSRRARVAGRERSCRMHRPSTVGFCWPGGRRARPCRRISPSRTDPCRSLATARPWCGRSGSRSTPTCAGG